MEFNYSIPEIDVWSNCRYIEYSSDTHCYSYMINIEDAIHIFLERIRMTRREIMMS